MVGGHRRFIVMQFPCPHGGPVASCGDGVNLGPFCPLIILRGTKSAKGRRKNKLAHLACLFSRLFYLGNSYIVILCAYCLDKKDD